MKTAIKNLFIVMIISLGVLSCEEADFFPCVKPVGNVLEEFHYTKDFHNIHLFLHANVHVRQGAEFAVTVKAAENILNHIDVSSNGTTLYIDNNRCLRTRARDVSIFITMPELESIRLLGSGNIYIETPFKGKNATIEVSGSGNVHFPEANFETIHLALSGSGIVNLGGTSTKNTVHVTGSGRINAFGMETNESNVRISGSGNVEVNVIDFLEARISGSGNIYYMGNPSVNVSITGTGKFNHSNGHQTL